MSKWGETVTGPSARRLIEQAGLLEPSEGPLVIFDNACGTGVVTSLLHETLVGSAKERLEITSGDISQRAVDAVQQRITHNGWQRTIAKIVDGQVCLCTLSALIRSGLICFRLLVFLITISPTLSLAWE